MPKEAKQKIKLLYIYEVLMRETDENHCMSAQDLIDYLAEKEIFVERKTIFSDIETLKEFGADICLSKRKDHSGYYIGARDFELAELKIITEAILSSRFISAKKSKDLINKLSSLVSPSEKKELKREVFVQGRVKTENESIYYNVDILHNSMMNNRQITFLYLQWTPDKELLPRRNGKVYRVSPWALTVKDENYYLIAFDSESGIIKHYRVDKMKEIKEVARSSRLGSEVFEVYDLGEYTNQNFGMFSGESDVVTIAVPNNLIGVVFDRFGKDIAVRPVKGNGSAVRIPVQISHQFFGWLAGMGPEFTILKPESAKKEFLEYLNSIKEAYEEEK